MDANLDYRGDNDRQLSTRSARRFQSVIEAIRRTKRVRSMAVRKSSEKKAAEGMPEFRKIFPEPGCLNDLGCRRLKAAILIQIMWDYYDGLNANDEHYIQRLDRYLDSSEYSNMFDIPADQVRQTVREWKKYGRDLALYINTYRKWIRDSEDADRRPLEFKQYVWPNYIHDLLVKDAVRRCAITLIPYKKSKEERESCPEQWTHSR